MISPVVRVRGAGVVSLPAEQLDYRAEAELVESCAGIGKRDLSGQIIPVKVSGPIANPKVQPEIPTGLIQALRRRQAAPAPAPEQSAGQQAAPPPPAEPQQPTKRGHVIKDARDELLRGIFQGILK